MMNVPKPLLQVSLNDDIGEQKRPVILGVRQPRGNLQDASQFGRS
jgi:hypothetical protein